MKKILLILVGIVALSGQAHAAPVLDEAFNYADGSLLTNSSFAWSNHSGTIGQMQVVGGKALVAQTNSEDVARGLSGAPYSSQILYASFVVNFAALPAGAGGYFAHFKDDGTSAFRARVFATVTGAGAGKFRVGIGNASSAVPTTIITTDLDLGTDYTLVVRYNTATAASTLWINPNSEGATSDTINASDGTTPIGITTFALRQSTASGNGMGTLTLDNLKVGTAFTDVIVGGDPTLNPPFISNIPGQNIPRNGTASMVPFYVTDGETSHGSLTLSAASSNTGLVPVNNISFTTDGGSNRTVTVAPAYNQQGVTEITVTVTDGDTNSATRTFLVIVGAPTVSTIANQTTPKDTPTGAIAFTVGDTEGDSLTYSAASTNEYVVPVSGIMFGGSGPNRTLTITPASGTNGLSKITVFVSDGYNTVSNSFILTVFPTLHIVLADGFNYPDGPASDGFKIWGTHSGSNGEARISSGKLLISGTNSEDISATFTNLPSYLMTFTPTVFPAGEGWIVYSRFTVNFSGLPRAVNGEYFAHFRNSGTGTSFGGKVFATTNGVPAGKLRLGISNNANAPANAIHPLDLNTGTDYTVVTRINVGTGQCKLWINPTSESDAGATPTDGAFPFSVETYSFREASGIGDMAVDDVAVGTSFSDVVHTGPLLTLARSGDTLTITWSGGGTLQYTDDLNDPPASISWHDIVDATSPFMTSTTLATHRWYRLRVP